MDEEEDTQTIRKEHTSFQAIINAIENYIQRITRRNALQLDDALDNLVALESDLTSIIDDIKKCLEVRA